MEHVTDRSISVHALQPQDRDWVSRTQATVWGSVMVVRKGELLDASTFPGYVAISDGDRVDLALFCVRGDEYEVVSVWTGVEGQGVGRALMQHCFDDARARGCPRVWLTTTNNNVRAIAFHQGLGMTLCAVYRDGVAAARQLKPSIPLRDELGIAIDHELEFELLV